MFSRTLVSTCVVMAHRNRPIETIPLSTLSMCLLTQIIRVSTGNGYFPLHWFRYVFWQRHREGIIVVTVILFSLEYDLAT